MDNNYKFELLKMARELLNEEYINRRAEDHNKWVAESDMAWKTRRIKLPYPPFAQYPTEIEIIAKAAGLYSFLSAEEAPVVPPGPDTDVKFATETSKDSPLDVQLLVSETAPVVERDKAVEPVAETKVELVVTPIVVLDPVVTTVVTEPKFEETPVVESVTKPVTSEPRPLFAVSSWLQKIQK